MPQPDPPSFHLRLPPDLKARLQDAAAKSGSSLNSEIVQRLELSTEPDAATHLADLMRPVLASLDIKDRDQAMQLVTDMVTLLSKLARKSRSRTSRK